MLIQSNFGGGDMNWYFLTLRDGVEASESQQKIKDVFLKFFTTSGVQESMGVFLKRDIMQRTTTFFFTPTAAAVAKIFKAYRCEQPPKSGITLIAGPDTCWNLFADKD